MAVLKITSFNLHGLNTSEEYLRCLLKSYDIVFIQEHWQFSRNFHRLASLSNTHDFIATDGMKDAAQNGLMLGRPYGGVACFWSKSLGKFITPLVDIPNPRVSAIHFKCGSFDIVLFNVYMPFLDGSNRTESINDFIETVSCIDMVMDDYPDSSFILSGDLNFEVGRGSPFEPIFNNLCRDRGRNIGICDSLFEGNVGYTFSNVARGVYKWLDHFSVSSDIAHLIDNYAIRRDADNFSDHLPISCSLKFDVPLNQRTEPSFTKRGTPGNVVWDRCNSTQLELYREYLDYGIDTIPLPEAFYCLNAHCNNLSHKHELEFFHSSIMHSMKSADQFLPRVKPGIEKSWWSHELDEAKQRCLEAHNLWKDAGSPRHGSLFLEKQSAKLLYKKLLRKQKGNVCKKKFDDMALNVLSKDQDAFWKGWKSLNGCKNKIPSNIGGCTDAPSIAGKFMDHFKKVSQPNNVTRCDEMNREFSSKHSDYIAAHDCNCNQYCLDLNHVIVMRLKPGKASNCELQSEHFLNGTVKLFTSLTACFNLFLTHSFVPSQYQAGTIMPLIKDPNGDASSLDNYRGITLGSVSSKVFERALSSIFGDFLSTGPHQFGFKPGMGTVDALYVFKRTVEYYNNRGSDVFVCFLDSSKAFDKVVHSGLFMKLIDRKLPLSFLSVLVYWYGGLTGVVR